MRLSEPSMIVESSLATPCTSFAQPLSAIAKLLMTFTWSQICLVLRENLELVINMRVPTKMYSDNKSCSLTNLCYAGSHKNAFTSIVNHDKNDSNELYDPLANAFHLCTLIQFLFFLCKPSKVISFNADVHMAFN